jgi:hypothetical protein
MFKKTLLLSALVACTTQAQIADVPITGNVASKCVITTDTPGVYGNPVSNKLSTLPTDGGVLPIVRYDIIEADSYKAHITWPQNFTTSPVLNDVVNWTGDVELAEVSDATMADFETNKVQWNNTTEYDLTVAGSAWFKITSVADYGFDKSFPGGQYRAAVTAECIAK